LDFRRAVRTIVAFLAAIAASSPSQAQSLVWTAHQHSGDGFPELQTIGSGLAAGPDGSAYALSLAYNGTQVGLLTKYSSTGFTLWTQIERVGWPIGVVADGHSRPLVLTPYETLAYDTEGRERWRVPHVIDGDYLQAVAIALAPGDGVYVAGSMWAAAQAGVLRLDQAGQVTWGRTYLPSGADSASVDGLGVDRAGRAYLVGRTTTASETGHFAAAIGPDGTLLWSRRVESPTLDPTQRLVLAVDPDGGAFVSWFGGTLDPFRVRRFDLSGAVAWDASVIAISGSPPQFAAALPAGGVVVGGSDGTTAAVAAFDALGQSLWIDASGSGSLGGLAAGDDGSVAFALAQPGTAVLRVKVYGPSGNVVWSKDSSGPWDTNVAARAVAMTPSGRVMVLADGTQQNLRNQFTLAFESTGVLSFVSFPGRIPSADWAQSVQFDPGGNALVLSTGYDGGYRDHILKYDRMGGLLWSREAFSGDPAIPVVAVDAGPNGETVAVGSWDSPFSGEGPQVAKLDAAGNVVWRRGDLLVPPFDQGGASSVLVDAQGSAYVAGWMWDLDTNESRLILGKYSADGQLLWRHYDAHPQAYTWVAVRMAPVAGNRVALAGTVYLPKDGVAAIRVAVVDAATGEEVWSSFAADPNSSPYVWSVVADSSGAVMVGTEFPGRLYRFGPAGALEWSRSSPDEYGGRVNAVAVDASNEITVAFAAPACHLARWSPAGDLLWERVVDFDGYCAALAARPAGGFFVAGAFFDPLDQTPHGYLAAYDAGGQSEWSRATGQQRAGPSALHFLDTDGSGRVLAAGYQFSGANDYDALAVVVSDDPKPPPALFFTVAPCRVADTRDPALGGPSPLPAGSQVDVPVAGRCGLPATARAIAANLTAVSPDSAGYFTAFPSGRMPPTASLLNHGPGATRASQAVLGLGDDGKLSLRAFQPTGGVHLIIDVAGYFE